VPETVRKHKPVTFLRWFMPMGAGGWSSVVDFYDGLADDYHLVYADRWDDAMRRQGDALDALIRSHRDDVRAVLDCSCGIGTQAIGLARLGYEVTGTDISARSLRRATEIARNLRIPLRTQTADFRALTTSVPGGFDAVISCDNAIPHLLDDADVDLALSEMFAKLRPGGILIISIRDYDTALRDRPTTAPPLDLPGPPRRIVVRVHEWDAPDSPLYTVRFLILTHHDGRWQVTDHATRYRALPAADLTNSATRAGLVDVRWFTAEEASFHQPVMIARRPE
jgi:SAM-dependent methyltransferase